MKTEERIEKEALDYADSKDVRTCSYHRGLKNGYVAGARSERNKTINEVLAMMVWQELKEELEALKT